MAHRMTDSEVRAFLSEGTRTGKLATVGAGGAPRVVPIWFVLDEPADGAWSLVFTTGRDSAKAKAMRRERRVALCVDVDEPPFAFVQVLGSVTLSEDLDEMLPWATRIGGRYMGQERADEFGRRNAVPGEVLIRLRPDKVIGATDIAD